MDDRSLKEKFSFHCVVKYFLFATNTILWVSITKVPVQMQSFM